MSGARNNSIRRNILFDLYNRGIEISSYSAATEQSINNWIYNNTFFNVTTRNDTGSNHAWIVLGTGGVATKIVTGNRIYNNIAEKVAQRNASDLSARTAIWYYYPYEQDLGDTLEELSITNDWRNNHLKNNCIRPYNPATSQYDDLATAVQYTNTGAYTPEWTVTDVNGVGSQSGNIRSDPLFTSTNTATEHWWYLQAGSPCLGTGIAVTDPNAATGGWSNISTPNIGAYLETSGVWGRGSIGRPIIMNKSYRRIHAKI